MAEIGLVRRSAVQTQTLTRSDVLIAVLLLVVILLGGYFRFVGLNWDDYTHLHPDERFLTDVASSLGGGIRSSLGGEVERQAQIDRCVQRYPDSGGVGAYFDAECSTLNPHNVGKGLYVYGTLPLFAARAAGDIMVQLTGDASFNNYNGVHLVWRALSALADMGAILVVFFIGLHLHGRWVGILAAALYAGTVLGIQLAHFGTVDAIAAFFAALSLLYAVRVQLHGQIADYALFGAAVGAAVASRVNLAPLVGLLVLAAMLRGLPVLDWRLTVDERWRLLRHTFGGLILAGAIAFLFFRVLNPYTFMGPGFFGLTPNPRWFDNIREAQIQTSGAAEIPPNYQWVGRTPYLFALNNMLTWGMGLALGLTGLLGIIWSGWRLIRGRPGALRNLLPVVWFVVYFGWLGRNWVASMRYFLPLYPVFALLAAWLLVELVWRTTPQSLRRILSYGLLILIAGFTLLWATMFTNVYRHQLTRVQASEWVWEQVSGDFSMRVEGSDAPLINIAIGNGYDEGTDIVAMSSVSPEGTRYETTFNAPADGSITAVYAPHLGDPQDDPSPESLVVEVADSSGTLGQGELTVNMTRENHILGDAYTIPLDKTVNVIEGQEYIFRYVVVDGGPILTGGSVVSHEGAWDDPIPYSVCTLPQGMTVADDPPPGMFSAQNCNGRNAWSGLLVGYDMQLRYEDLDYKRDVMLQALNDSDYLTISSNRFYDSLSRIPVRWPMTNAYYRALFAGGLGYELERVFTESFELGPLHVSDQYLPIYDSPAWLNEFEAEEAFHVYDHPAVFVFRKTADYDRDAVAAFFNAMPLNRSEVVGTQVLENCPAHLSQLGAGGCDAALVDTLTLSALQADVAPTQLMLTPDRQAIQDSGGTWSDRFDRSSAINQQPSLTIAVWWLAIMCFGWITWPLLFAMFPGMADRGYAVAKIAGLVLVAWTAWAAGTAELRLWSQGGILLLMLILALLSLIVALRQRVGLLDCLRRHWTRLVAIEAITLLLFVAFLGVRLMNPDLWHTNFGGEKPMDFSYFNAVLRSSIFPPYDPWYAGGYLNYYYFGYVIVGSPVLLLGIVPSVAYNLIVPTLFALTGIGAFAVAFNLIARWRSGARMANPWLAGVAALLLVVVLGNLDTPRVFGNALASLGGYQRPMGLADFLVEEYRSANDGIVDLTIENDLRLRAQNNALGDRIRYEINASLDEVSGMLSGLGKLLGGDTLPLAAHRWYWAPTRVIGETPEVGGNAINEMPYFTFLYGDLHAHMIAMPLLLFIMGFVAHEIIIAGQDSRRWPWQLAALALGALMTGILRATNTWDWPTFTLLAVFGLALAWWLSKRGISRQSLLTLALRVGGFGLMSLAVTLPYTSWYAAIYGSISPWEGGKTPLWAYFDVHGLFLFLLFSLLVWDTARWLRSVYVRDLRGMWPLLVSLAVAFLAAMVGVVFLAIASYQVVLIAVPLLLWMAALFMRPGQSRAMQYVLTLAGLAVGLTLGVEFIVLAGDIGRQNTVFKFYIQAWLLFSIVGGTAFAILWQRAAAWRLPWRYLWYAGAAVLFTTAALYPITATRGRAVDRMAPETPLTLDGMAYMVNSSFNENGSQFSLADDYYMIRWLQEHVEGAPTVIEAQSAREYLWSGRVAIYTGLPSVLGWRFHQTQQRTLNDMPTLINERRSNINAFYTTTDEMIALDMIRFYQIEYIIVGSLEKAYYPPEGLAKFEDMAADGLLEKVYEQGEAAVFRVADTVQVVQAVN